MIISVSRETTVFGEPTLGELYSEYYDTIGKIDELIEQEIDLSDEMLTCPTEVLHDIVHELQCTSEEIEFLQERAQDLMCRMRNGVYEKEEGKHE